MLLLYLTCHVYAYIEGPLYKLRTHKEYKHSSQEHGAKYVTGECNLACVGHCMDEHVLYPVLVL